MRLLIIILTLTTTFVNPTCGQIVNSISVDKTGMYYYSLDSLTKLIKDVKKIDRLILRADWSIIQDFPDKINGLTILKEKENKKIKTNDLKPTDVLIKINGLSIIRDQITLSMQTFERQGKDLKYFSDVVYIFYYKYLPDTQTYKLNNIKSGLRL